MLNHRRRQIGWSGERDLSPHAIVLLLRANSQRHDVDLGAGGDDLASST